MRRNIITVQEGELEITLYHTDSRATEGRAVEDWQAYARTDLTESGGEIIGWATLPEGLTDEQVAQEFRNWGAF